MASGRFTPGDFVLLQSFFAQLAFPLFSLGNLFRQLDEGSVDVIELYHVLKAKPIVKEKPDAKEFKYEQGKVTFDRLSFQHSITEDLDKDVKRTGDEGEAELPPAPKVRQK